ncbi:hypothetical protein DI272_23665 [Streptomyces sp. Act143]|uniref:hypothetical protein n=1 Tax=Streptomyces sp. Act143 TaxID=2200760 RepID=UPI000D67B017|nr:hypothetical protein [Streptomyces sp. Act143]PWI16828.1 hypothetical protein DI272_23665 [Streptomyces sp. Act143]
MTICGAPVAPRTPSSTARPADLYGFRNKVGHTFGLDDFYDWTPTGQCCFLMEAGSATRIMEFDQWMPRDFRRRLKGR